jgi:steroid delta-isomerase-like uncharacterized protein
MTMEANKASARRFVDEVVNRGNLALIDELLAPDLVDHAASPGVPPNREGAKTFFAMLRGAFPDLHVTIDDQIAEGDRVVLRTTTHGTMKGEFAGMPPSGKSATWATVHILRFANGKTVEHWAVDDRLSMLQQLGFAEAPGQPASVAG